MQSGMYSSHFTPLQLEFYATTSTELEIIPTYTDTQIFLKGRTIGPFKANQQTNVPTWLAIFLRQQHKCKIVVPSVLRLQDLQEFVNQQNSASDPIFLHDQNFFQMAYTLLNRAPDTFEKARQVRSLIESLQTIRYQKMRRTIQKSTGGRRLRYLTSYQINKWRTGLSSLQKMIDKLGRVKQQ